ncbi:uncharacterized protein Dvar_48910 [Desulfosarcina variabilis str. Montpellier]
MLEGAGGKPFDVSSKGHPQGRCKNAPVGQHRPDGPNAKFGLAGANRGVDVFEPENGVGQMLCIQGQPVQGGQRRAGDLHLNGNLHPATDGCRFADRDDGFRIIFQSCPDPGDELIDRYVALIAVGKLQQQLGQIDAFGRLTDDALDVAHRHQLMLDSRKIGQATVHCLNAPPGFVKGVAGRVFKLDDHLAAVNALEQVKTDLRYQTQGVYQHTNDHENNQQRRDTVSFDERQHLPVPFHHGAKTPVPARLQARQKGPAVWVAGTKEKRTEHGRQGKGDEQRHEGYDHHGQGQWFDEHAHGPAHDGQGEQHYRIGRRTGQNCDKRLLGTQRRRFLGGCCVVQAFDDTLEHDNGVGDQDRSLQW